MKDISHGWGQVKVWILKDETSHSKCISKLFLLLSERYLNPEIQLYSLKSPICALYRSSSIYFRVGFLSSVPLYTTKLLEINVKGQSVNCVNTPLHAYQRNNKKTKRRQHTSKFSLSSLAALSFFSTTAKQHTKTITLCKTFFLYMCLKNFMTNITDLKLCI